MSKISSPHGSSTCKNMLGFCQSCSARLIGLALWSLAIRSPWFPAASPQNFFLAARRVMMGSAHCPESPTSSVQFPCLAVPGRNM